MGAQFVLVKFLSWHHAESWVAIGLIGSCKSGNQVYLTIVFNLLLNMKAGKKVFTVLKQNQRGEC